MSDRLKSVLIAITSISSPIVGFGIAVLIMRIG
jgi:hypothetical protein